MQSETQLERPVVYLARALDVLAGLLQTFHGPPELSKHLHEVWEQTRNALLLERRRVAKDAIPDVHPVG